LSLPVLLLRVIYARHIVLAASVCMCVYLSLHAKTEKLLIIN